MRRGIGKIIQSGFFALIIFSVIFWSVCHDIKMDNIYEDACIACGYNEVTDYKTFGNLNSENYDIVECDNHFQITVFTHIYVKDKWNVSHWIKKTWINCEDFRNQSYPESYYPVVEYPNTYWETGHIEVI